MGKYMESTYNRYMFVIDIIALAKNAPQGALTYRTTAKVSVGDVVTVPLRKKLVRGIVTAVVPAREVRTMLRTASFTVRAGTPTKVGALPKAYLVAGNKIAEEHATTLGTALSVLVPPIISETEFPKLDSGDGFVLETIELPYEKRVEEYIARALEARAERKTLLIIAPTLVEVERLAARMKEAGCASLSITGALTPKRRAAVLEKISNAPEVVIATPAFLFVPIPRLAGIVLERESGNGYLMQARPDIDFRHAARALGDARAVPLLLGDYPLRIEVRKKPEAPLAISPPGSITILDVRKKEDAERKTFTSIPEPAIEALRAVIAKGGRAAVIAVRKGYAPTVVCRDCGTAVKDAEGRALSLSIGLPAVAPAQAGGTKRIFRSSDGKIVKDTNVVCDVCGGWNLFPLGVGIERVLEDLKKVLPNANFVRFDTDSIRTPGAARKASDAFRAPGTIIVGTEALLPFLDTTLPLDLCVIASADSLLALPFWRARERFVRLALTLREHSKKTILVTRRPKDAALSAALEPETSNFFSEEVMLRKALGYPPFETLLLVSYEGNAARVSQISETLQAAAKEYSVTTFSPRAPAAGARSALRGASLIKIPSEKWPDAALSTALRALSPAVRTLVDPERLW